eukprot:jgi/Chlat1/4547/Chrsp29S04595
MAAPLRQLLGLLLLAFLQLAAASHFRYGTISWIPLQGPNADGSFSVQFTFRAAFRRNYEWGKWFREQWQITSSSTYPDPNTQLNWHGTETFWRTVPSNCATNPNQAGCFTCPAGSTLASNGAGCQNIAPTIVPQQQYFYVKFPYSVYSDNTIVKECPTPFYCDYPGPSGTLPADCGSSNTAYATNKNLCAPWSQVYGFFYGDGLADNVILQLDTVDASSNLITGNYVRGVSRWVKTYTPQTALPTNYPGSGAPVYTAFYTGGDRIYECSVPWNTNPGGRFRLEITVSVTGDGNRSPIASQIPVMPVMHVSYPNYAKFQIAAYDLDPVDNRNLQFTFGDQMEMGGIMRSRADGVFNKNQYYGNFDCNSNMYTQDRNGDGQPDNACPNDRTPQQTPQTSNSFDPSAKVPGLVVWQTWTTGPGTKLRGGLYNMVVMVRDSKVKVPLDFMLYLYDGNLNFCNHNCKNNIAGTPTFNNVDGTYGNQECTICGLGDGDFTMCTPDPLNLGTGNATCGQTSGNSVVPVASACQGNTLPTFIRTGDPNKNPGVENWFAALDLSQYNVPTLTHYRGEDFDFDVIAEDTDDCTMLIIETTGLPEGAFLDTYVSLTPPNNSLGERGTRTFTWPGTADPALDTRPAISQVCFYAFDQYLITATPFYCVQLKITDRPVSEDQVLVRYECKMALIWQTANKQFGFTDGTDTWYSNCTYEDYMWHHAMVAIDGEGHGNLAVDGQVVAEFDTGMYPIKCTIAQPPPPSAPPPPEEGGGRRRLLQDDNEDGSDGGDSGDGNPADAEDGSDDHMRMDGFVDTDDVAVGDPNMCCSFKIGMQCSDGTLLTFDGFIDEVVVYNRFVPLPELHDIMFKMPLSLPSRELEAPRGEQLDYTAGRVLWARFNNPCQEGLAAAVPSPPPPSPPPPGPAPSPPPPPPPSPPPPADEGGGRRRLLQMEEPAFDRSASYPVNVPAVSLYVTDKAGYTAGMRNHAKNATATLDLDNDYIYFAPGSFPSHSRYAYTGAPFAPPLVVTHPSPDSDAYPVGESNMVTFTGVGFARSPFLSCGLFADDNARTNMPYTPRMSNEPPRYYDQYFTQPNQKYFALANPFHWVYTTVGSLGPAEVANANGNIISQDDVSAAITATGHFMSNLQTSRSATYIYGGWTSITCASPPAPFATEQMFFAASNDGLVGIPGEKQTFMEEVLELTGDEEVSVVVGGILGDGMTVGMWVQPNNDEDEQTLFKISGTTGTTQSVQYYYGKFVVNSPNFDSQQYNAANVSSVNEWHYVALSVGGVATLYVDGVVMYQSSATTNLKGVVTLKTGNFTGLVDELRWFNVLVDDDVLASTAWTSPLSPMWEELQVLAYLRFSENVDDSTPDGQAVTSSTGTLNYKFTPVPWHPSWIYTINGVNYEEIQSIPKSKLTGGETLDIAGFNFAPSPWLSCTWGVKEVVQDFTICEENQPGWYPEQCADGVIVGDSMQHMLPGSISDPTCGTKLSLATYNMTAVFRTDANATNPDGRELTCNTPTSAQPMVLFFGATPLTANPMVYEITEASGITAALECSGDNSYMTAVDSEVNALLNGDGYAFGAWVMPYDMPAPAEEMPVRRRSLLSKGDKRGLIRAVRSGDVEPVSTVLSFESNNGKNSALVMYDGHRFFYYDDAILDVTRTGPPALPNQWHHVFVSIDSEGEGQFYVDGELASRFTTTSKPNITGIFSICQDYRNSDLAAPSEFFAGLVDEVMVFNKSLTSDEVAQYTWGGSLQGDEEGLAAYYKFTSLDDDNKVASLASDPAAVLTAVNVDFVQSAAPWLPPNTLAVIPDVGDVAGGQEVSVIATNLASTKWLGAVFNGVQAPAEGPLTHGNNVFTVTQPPQGDAFGPGQVFATNSPNVDVSNIPEDFPAQFFVQPSVTDLNRGLEAHYTFNFVPDSNFADNNVMTITDSSGNDRHGIYVLGDNGLAQLVEDRNAIDNGAVLVGPFTGGANLTLPVPASYLSQDSEAFMDFTISMWVRVDYEQSEDVLQMLQGAHIGCYKHIAGTYSDGSGAVYINGKNAMNSTDASILEFIGAGFTEFLLQGTILSAVNGRVDEVWVYSRALSEGELTAQYFTSEYALDFTRDANATVFSPASFAADSFTLEAWIYAYSTEGPQAILSRPYADGLVSVSFGIKDDRLYLAVLVGCDCEPCEVYREVVSWRATVLEGRWQHVAATYVPSPTGVSMFFYIDGILKDKQVFVDIPRDIILAADVPILIGQDSTEGETNRFNGLITGVAITDEGMRRNINDVDLSALPEDFAVEFATAGFTPPYVMKDRVRCPNRLSRFGWVRPKSSAVAPIRSDYVTHAWSMSEGTGPAASDYADFHTSDAMPLMGADKLWANISYDDSTDPHATELVGPGVESIDIDGVGVFSITARTKCFARRLTGGDNFQVQVLVAANDSITVDAEVVDMDDGTYLVAVQPVPGQCGPYNVNVTMDDELAASFVTLVMAGPSSANTTVPLTNVSDANPAGVMSSFTVQAKDDSGCLRFTGGDNVTVTLTGPHDIVADVVDNEDGTYTVTYTPQVMGTYVLTATINTTEGPAAFLDGVCVEVSAGTSLFFNGQTSVEVEDTRLLGLTTSGFTMEAWVSPRGVTPSPPPPSPPPPPPPRPPPPSPPPPVPPPPSPPPPEQSGRRRLLANVGTPYYINPTFRYVFNKNDQDKAGVDTRSYDLKFSPTYDTLMATVYAGNGEWRRVSAPFQLTGGWTHIAAVYNQTSFTLYQDGVEITSKSYDVAKRIPPNNLQAPLDIGYAFTGMIDEAKLWKVARTQQEIIDTMHCPPYMELDKIAGYWPFNEGQGDIAKGYSADCWVGDNSNNNCLQGDLDPFNAPLGPPSWLGGLGSFAPVEGDFRNQGVGAPSARFSVASGRGLTNSRAYSGSLGQYVLIQAKDECKYCYLGREARFAVETTRFDLQYFQDTHDAVEYPILHKQDTVQHEPAINCPEQDQCYGSVPNIDGAPSDTPNITDPEGPFRKLLSLELPNGLFVSDHRFGPGDTSCLGDLWLATYHLDEAGSYLLNVLLLGDGTRPDEPLVPAPFTLEVTAGDLASLDLVGGQVPTAVAGVPSSFIVVAKDSMDPHANVIVDRDASYDVTRAITINHMLVDNVVVVPEVVSIGQGAYQVVYTAPTPGPYNLFISLLSTPQSTLQVLPARWAELLTDDETLPLQAKRFEHTAAAYNGSIYIFGGALYDKTYLNDMWMLEGACTDIVFRVTGQSTILDHVVDSWTCGKPETVFWVSIPGDNVLPTSFSLEMFYGNPAVISESKPETVFAFYEDFEGEGDITSTPFVPAAPCGVISPSADGFDISEELPYAGRYSLHAKYGFAGALQADIDDPTDSFILRAQFYDSDSETAAHFISPDWDVCGGTPDGERLLLPDTHVGLLPDTQSTAVGVYTLSTVGKYATASPWESAYNATRNAGWHLFEVRSDSTGTTVSIDGVPVYSDPNPIVINKIFISAGIAGLDDLTGVPNVLPAHAFWDDITVIKVHPATVGAVIEPAADGEDTQVNWVPERMWSQVSPQDGVSPPPRYSHSAVVYNDAMYVYGGERSAYAFSDVWEFSFTSSSWRFISPQGDGGVPPARFDHAAGVLSDGTMIVYGGRSGHALYDDMWVYSIDTRKWRSVTPTSVDGTVAGKRFGHSIAVSANDVVYIYGGYTDRGFSNEFFSYNPADNVLTQLNTFQLSSDDNNNNNNNNNYVGRYSHASVAYGSYIYIHGGSSLKQEYNDMWQYDTNTNTWTQAPSSDTSPFRFEHAAVVVSGVEGEEDKLCIQGGHGQGEYHAETLCYPVPFSNPFPYSSPPTPDNRKK